MWRSREPRGRTSVVCIACGTSVLREDAREYDKHGDRWERTGKQFEYLCTECDDALCHQPRGGLESLLTTIEANGLSRAEFCRRYAEAVHDRRGAAEFESDR